MGRSNVANVWAAAAAVVGLVTGTASATIVQFDAASGTLGSDFVITPVAGAIGGNVISDTVAGNSGPQTVASYSVNFTQAGSYDLYLRLVTTSSASADSLFIATDFGVRDSSNMGNTAEWLSLNGWSPFNNAFNGVTTLDGQVWQQGANQIPNNTLIWVNLTANFKELLLNPNNGPEVGTYDVAAPGTLTFQIAGREANFQIDALAFVLTSERGNVVQGVNGALALIPEPASLALMGTGVLLMMRRRR